MPLEPKDVRLRIVTGKGGVGKTTIACALALQEVRQGKKVLLCEAKGRSRTTEFLGTKSASEDIREVEENLFIVDMNPEAAIREYALLMLRFKPLYNAVFENRLIKTFIRLVPSLGELVMLGKIWFHEQEQHLGKSRFDVIIFDAPATGHARLMLHAPQAMQTTVPPGPLRQNARLIQKLLTDMERTALHLVTIPEEMPINEAIELEQAARESLGIHLGTTFINQGIPALCDEDLKQLKSTTLPGEWTALKEVLETHALQSRDEKQLLQELPAKMLDNALHIPQIIDQKNNRQTIEAIADLLEAASHGE